MRQYKCIITLSQSASYSYHICSLHFYWFWWAIACSLGGNSEYDIFPQQLECSAIFPVISIFSSWKKGRYPTTGREWVKFRASLILYDIEESIQLFYLYLPAYVLGVLVILTILPYFCFNKQSYFWSINCEAELKGISIIILSSVLWTYQIILGKYRTWNLYTQKIVESMKTSTCVRENVYSKEIFYTQHRHKIQTVHIMQKALRCIEKQIKR